MRQLLFNKCVVVVRINRLVVSKMKGTYVLVLLTVFYQSDSTGAKPLQKNKGRKHYTVDPESLKSLEYYPNYSAWIINDAATTVAPKPNYYIIDPMSLQSLEYYPNYSAWIINNAATTSAPKPNYYIIIDPMSLQNNAATTSAPKPNYYIIDPMSLQDSLQNGVYGNGEDYIAITEDPGDDGISNDPCTATPTIPEIEKKGIRVSEYYCQLNQWNTKNIFDTEEILMSEQCKAQSGIFGGTVTEQGDSPHMGAVGFFDKSKVPHFLCGSSLISEYFVISSAHCALYNKSISDFLLDLTPSIVRFGCVSLMEADCVDRSIIERHVLNQYYKKRSMRYNDIALFKLDEAINFSKYIRPACLFVGSLEGQTVGNITGWGKTEKSDISPTLLSGTVNFFEWNQCANLLNNKRNRNWPDGLRKSQFCAGRLDGTVDACQGDSGGPIEIKRPLPMDGKVFMNYVVGITSFGIGCGAPQLPGLYTNVTNFICWIEKIVWPEENNEACLEDSTEDYIINYIPYR